MAQAFDTLETARSLEAGGFERAQAEALAAAIRKASSAGHENFATTADLYKAALAIVAANSAITFSLLKLLLP